MGPRITGSTSSLWTVDLATTTMQTPRLTQQYQMTTMTSPPSPVNLSHLCSHHASRCPLLPSRGSLLPPCDDFSGDFVSQFVVAPRRPATLNLKTSLKTTGCLGGSSTKCPHLSWRHIGAAFLRNAFSLHCRDTTGASALTSCETSPLQPICRLTV